MGLATIRIDCVMSNLKALGPKGAEMQIVGCDLHVRQQTVAMLDTGTGEVVEKILEHEGEKVREFYASLPGPVLGGSMPPDRCSGF